MLGWSQVSTKSLVGEEGSLLSAAPDATAPPPKNVWDVADETDASRATSTPSNSVLALAEQRPLWRSPSFDRTDATRHGSRARGM